MSDYTPKVSIITPSYNQAQFLEQTIRSVLSQDYPNIEYIIIDGGSNDGSQAIIERYADQIDYWVSEPDSGQSDAINKGFRKATGEIIAWLNSDDLYLPGAVSTAVEQFRKNRDLTLFYGDCVFIGERGEFLRYFDECEEFNRFRLLNCSDFIMQPTTFFRRDAAEAVGFLDESLNWAMDWDLWCKLVVAGGQVHCEPTLIAANRDYGETKTNVGGGKRILEIRRMIKRHSTSIYPHALASYWLAMIRSKVSALFPESFREYEGYSTALTLPLQLLTPSNFWQQLVHSRGVHGVGPGLRGTLRLIGPESSIIFPRPKQLTGMEILIKFGTFEAPCTMRITVDGHEACVFERSEFQRARIVIPAEAMDSRSELVRITFSMSGPASETTFFPSKRLFGRLDHLATIEDLSFTFDESGAS